MTKNELTGFLTEAAEAHHAYEAETGKRDGMWAAWYADYILTKHPQFAQGYGW